jgi:hypothetical protein
MPYIKQHRRLQKLSHAALGAGELNYKFTQLIVNYAIDHGLSYETINDIVGALEGAKAEFYRRVVVPYEDKKITENGDVYDPVS